MQPRGPANELQPHAPCTASHPAPCRVRYDQTIGDVRAAVAAKLGVPAERQQPARSRTKA